MVEQDNRERISLHQRITGGREAGKPEPETRSFAARARALKDRISILIRLKSSRTGRNDAVLAHHCGMNIMILQLITELAAGIWTGR
jgi:hypothetical protein